ncbi:hypothetical protein KXJ74_11215 [Acinetobacter johnsonii]|nr:hypothetical protein KXJ74_11215 [Acinetobacter johnsonii]
MKLYWSILILLGMPCLAQAGAVYKCNLKGSIIYQSKPCPGVTADTNFQKEQRLYGQTRTSSQPKAKNGTTNEIADTEDGKKKSLAIAQDAYKMTKER